MYRRKVLLEIFAPILFIMRVIPPVVCLFSKFYDRMGVHQRKPSDTVLT